MGSVYTG